MPVNDSTVTVVLLHIILCVYWLKAPTILEQLSQLISNWF